MSSNSAVKAGILFTVLLFLYSLHDRAPDVDDAWIGEQAYWMSKLGYVRSELMRGITMQEIRLICHHKLLTLQGALFIKLFGFSLVTLKSVSLVYLLAFLLVFTRYTYNRLLTPGQYSLFLLLFLTNALVFQYSFVFRPEIMVMTLGFCSYVFLDKALRNERNDISALLLGGIFAGLAVAAHLNGLIFAIAGFLLLVRNRKMYGSLLFGLAALPAVAIYFYDFTPVYNFRFWHYQLFENPYFDVSRKLPYGLSYLLNIATEQKRFFHSQKEASFYLLFFTVCVISFKHLKQHRNLIIYTGLLVLFLAGLTPHKTPKYLLLTLPYFLLLLLFALQHLTAARNAEQVIFRKITYRKALPAVKVLLVVYLLVNTSYNYYTAQEENVVAHNSALVAQYIPEDTRNLRIIAPMTFVFNQLNNFEAIQSEMVYGEKQKTDETIVKTGFLDLSKSYNIDYIILSKDYIQKLQLHDLPEAEIREQQYEKLVASPEMMILKRK